MIKCKGNYTALVKQLKEQQKDFEVRKTTKSTMVIFDEFKYMYSDSHFRNQYLNLFGRMKKEVHENIVNKEIVPPAIHRSKYFEVAHFDPIGLGEFISIKDCIEFDINKAYYNALLILGYISEEFYQECIKLPKNIRLALVGTLATQKTIFYYEKGELKYFETKKDDLLRRVFFQLVEYVDKALDYFRHLAQDNFLFYWVDGIYLKNYERAQYHRDLIEYEFNLKFSNEPIKEVMILNKAVYQTQIVIKKVNNKVKTFSLNNIFVRNEINLSL